jgi:hypothetical protein
VVHGGEGEVRAAEFSTGQAQALEGLRASDLVDQVTVNVNHGGAVPEFPDKVRIPNFVKECFSHSAVPLAVQTMPPHDREPPVDTWADPAGGGDE